MGLSKLGIFAFITLFIISISFQELNCIQNQNRGGLLGDILNIDDGKKKPPKARPIPVTTTARPYIPPAPHATTTTRANAIITSPITTKRPEATATKVTTKKPDEITTKKNETATTKKPEEVTTKKSETATTKKPDEVTTKKVDEATTKKPEETTKKGDETTVAPMETTTFAMSAYELPLPGDEPPRKVTLKMRKKEDNQAVKTEYWPPTYCLAAGDFTQPKGKCFAFITCPGEGIVPTEKECKTGEYFDPFTAKCGKDVNPEKCQVCTSKVDGEDITEGGKKYICKRYHPRSS